MEVEDKVLQRGGIQSAVAGSPSPKQCLLTSHHFPTSLKAHVGSRGEPLNSECLNG